MGHKIFGERAAAHQTSSEAAGSGVPPSNTTSVLIQAQTSQDKSKDDHQQKTSKRTAEEVLAAIEEKKWDTVYVYTFGSNKVVTAELSLCILQDATFYQMDLEVFRELELLSETFEESLRNIHDRDDDRPVQETDVQEYKCDEGGGEKDKEPQPVYANRRDRQGRGNRYASVMNFLLN